MHFYNIRNFGAKGDNKTDDTLALTKAIEAAILSGGTVYIPRGAYIVSKPITIDYSHKPIPFGLAGIVGDGYQSVLYAKSIPSGRGVLEFLGNSNTNAVNLFCEGFRIAHQASCDPLSWCMRMGDANNGFLGKRLWLDGANGLQLRVGSSTNYAQVNTLFQQVFLKSNYANMWGKDTELKHPTFAMGIESGGAKCDNIKFIACEFNGLVHPRATIISFDSCQFFTHPGRPTINHINYADNIYMNVGNASFRDCYFEDHRVAIRAIDGSGPVKRLIIDGCYFSGNTNYEGQKCERAIEVQKMDATKFGIDLVVVRESQFGKYNQPDPIYIAGVKNKRVYDNVFYS